MSGIVLTILSLAALLALACLNISLPLWTFALGAGLVAVSPAAAGAGEVLVVIGWAAFWALMLLNIDWLRQRWVIAPARAVFRRLLPRISQTEQEALDAGTVWWDAELFSGRPKWRRLLELPRASLSTEEQAFLDGPTEQLCAMVNDWEISNELKDLPEPVWEFIRGQGFLGMIIPKRYGGLGFSPIANSAITMKIATRCNTAAVSVMVPNSLGPAELLMHYGTEAQREYYLPRLARGEEIPCFALTNPLAGSDAAAIPDHGVVCHGEYRGERVLGMRVNFEKRYITLAPVASLVGLAFQLSDPDGLLGGDADVGITLALVPRDIPGMDIGRRHYPARQAFQNGPISGRDVFIPMSMVIGGQERCGQGWRMLMNCLAAGRSISLPASSTGALKYALRTTTAYARVREQFNVAIGRMEGVAEQIAELAMDTYAVDAARLVTAAVLREGEEPAVLSALLKYQATERMRRGMNIAMDVHGGRGIIEGPSNYLFSAYQAVPVGITVEGANILTRSLIVFGQGALRCHPWLLKEIAAARDEDDATGLAAFDAALGGHCRHVLMLIARNIAFNLSLGLLPRRRIDTRVGPLFGALERAALRFNLVAEASLLLLGGDLKRREALSGRFADALSELYIASATLKHFRDHWEVDADLATAVVARSVGVVDERLQDVLANLPSRPLAFVLRLLTYPWPRRGGPSDRLRLRIADAVLSPGAVRDRLTAGMYLNTAPDDITGCLEHAMALVEQLEPLTRRLRQASRDGRLRLTHGEPAWQAALAARIINEAEAAQLEALDKAVRRVIDVDDFPADALAAIAQVQVPMSEVA